jgi:hypothetical protein
MPEPVTTAKGDTVEVLTREDYEEIVEHVLDKVSSRFFRWLFTGGIVLVFTVVAGYFKSDARLNAVEREHAVSEVSRTEDAREMRVLTRKVDSLTIILANQTELLRDINRRLR